jgi:hypothetical protein
MTPFAFVLFLPISFDLAAHRMLVTPESQQYFDQRQSLLAASQWI